MRLPLISHRGRVAKEKGNLISHMKEALKLPISGLEVDIRITKDGVPVAHHNKTIKGKRISSLTYDELKGKTGKDENVPLLEDVVKLIKNKVELVIEIKSKPVEPIIKILKKYKIKKVVLISFWAGILREIRRLDKKIETGLIYSRSPFPVWRARRNDAQYLVPYYRFVTKRIIDKAHKKNLKVVVWSVNKVKKAESLLKMGVDGIATDNVKGLLKIKC